MKLNRPFTDLPYNVDMQICNGINMGRILQSRTACKDITNHLATTMTQNLVQSIINSDSKFGIMIDESSTISKKTALTICTRTVLNGASEATSFFLKLVEVENTVAQTIVDTILNTLEKFGLTKKYLENKLISFTTDGASNMLGRKNGVAKQMKDLFPFMTVWHCSNHRLELAVQDVISSMNEVIYFIYFLFFSKTIFFVISD